MKKTIGIFAHVDAGKTTFTEQLLFHTGSIKNLGRVDHKTSCMDTDEIEKNRGITIFADQGSFHFKEDTYYIIDTPGHIDFSAEAERAIQALDYAILLVDGSSGIQAHNITLFKMLNIYEIPTFIFINKNDIETFNLELIIDDVKNRLTDDILYINSIDEILNMNSVIAEFVAERDEDFLVAYLEDCYTSNLLQETITTLIKSRLCFPVMSGSALKGKGIYEFLEMFSKLSPSNYEELENNSFAGKVYKIRHDHKGNRLVFVKALTGRLHIKDEFVFEVSGNKYVEKVNEIRTYNGDKYENKDEVFAGDLFAIVGLKTPVCGAILEDGKINMNIDDNHYLVPTLQSKMNIMDETDPIICMGKLRILESEDPMLSVTYHEEAKDILINVMGRIQLEVLERVIDDRFNISVSFEKPQVQYRETIASLVVGYGHFEPLRHYSEVQLRLEPNNRGEGITFETECHTDNLAVNYQRAVKNHIFEKSHKGILTGSPITDIKIVLQNGRAHIKHTEGGDFREATYRAIRQGLEKAESILLEPFYSFEIYVEGSYLGKVMSDIQKLRGFCETPIQTDGNVCIKGRGPVETFMEYSIELTSFTRGKGSISLLFDGYDTCQNAEEVIERIGYDKDRDVENTSSSVFCAKGTSFIVPWYEAENYMHTIES